MYPVIRMTWQMWKTRKSPKLPFDGTHISTHYCLPWDLDIFWELNNGRTLTLYDLGRIPLGHRTGLIDALRRRGWGLTVAGSSPRYRRRIRAFEKITMKSRGIGWDDRFFYVEQTMWKTNGDCAGHVLIRSAATGPNGIVPPTEVVAEMGLDPISPPLPDWVTAWVAADAKRPWPPMQE
ncbi:acyl-CoA thioesterase [Marivivens marinus]|uniref:acyl-CoA thioesterase n=1 Tax=Marivivens marinus TaxID=3110173 RepID=UPI003B84831C